MAIGKNIIDKKDFQLNVQTSTRLFSVISLLVISAVAVISVFLWQSFRDIHIVTDRVAMINADKVLTSLAKYRDFYTEFVVPRGRAAGMQFSHDYLESDVVLPLPATFIKDFADVVTSRNLQGETKIRFVSDMPFDWRIGKEAELDSFEQEAMQYARQEPDENFWRIEERDGERILRVARPDTLSKQVCVNCHNSYPGTPKQDWQLGDVRGIFSLSVPLSRDEGSIREGYLDHLYILGLSILALLILLSWTLIQLRSALRIAQANNLELVHNNQLIEEKVAQTEHLNTLLRSEQGKLESVFSAVSDMIVLIDEHGIIQNVNTATMALFGYSRQELLGKNINIIMPESIAQEHDHYLQRYLARYLHDQSAIALQPRRVTAQDKMGNLMEVELEVRSIHVGDRVWFVGVLRDIRAQLEIEQNLKGARDEAIRMASLKSQFLANMSHELRTPLNGMISMSQLLEEDLKTPVLKDRAKVISSSAKHLLSIVNDILDFSRIQSGKFELYPKPLDVKSWLMDSLAIHLQVAKDKEIGLSLEVMEGVPKCLAADSLRLSQILHNLLSNALKFTTQGDVSIRLSLANRYQQADQEMAEIHLAVKDSGMGMSENALKALFQPFSQVDNSASRVHGGTGLGLMISCELAQMMQGGIDVSSELEKGSVFTVRAHLAIIDDTPLVYCHRDIALLDKFAQKTHQDHAHTAIEEDTGLHQAEPDHPYQLLVVEDNPVNQKVVAALLKRFGYTYDLANHGEEALARLDERQYDLILMDCQMPILDGYETTRKLRHREADTGQHLPVIALTAHAMEGEDQKCYAAGMDDYITKPLDHALLKQKIEHWLKR